MFDKYEKILYPINIDGKDVEKVLTDLSTSLKISYDAVQNFGWFEYYTIEDGDTPESVAYKAYGDVKKHFLVMLTNERFNWLNEWPLTEAQLESLCKEKYENFRGVHHYENVVTGEVITPIYDPDETVRSKRFKSVEDQVFVDEEHTVLAAEITPITNYEYEKELNDNKRYIILIKKQYISKVESALEALL